MLDVIKEDPADNRILERAVEGKLKRLPHDAAKMGT